MAKVQVQVAGGNIKQERADTVGELKEKLGVENYTACVNEDLASDDYELSDFEFVSLARPTKAN